jgi:hypothetical protein
MFETGDVVFDYTRCLILGGTEGQVITPFCTLVSDTILSFGLFRAYFQDCQRRW